MANGRPLTSFEATMETLTRHQGNYNVLIASRLRGALDLPQLQQAIAHLQARHPQLQGCIMGNPETECRFMYGQAEAIPSKVIPLAASGDRDAAITQELTTPFPSDRFLMRCILLSPPKSLPTSDSTHYLLTTLHHAICDGASAVQLQTELLELCAQSLGQSPQWATPTPPFDSIDDHKPASPKGVLSAIKGFLKLLVQAMFLWYCLEKQTKARLPPVPETSLPGQVYFHTQRVLGPERTQNLVSLCRQNHTTVQGALCAAMMVAVKPWVVSEDSDGKALKMGCASSVDLRRRCDPPIDPKPLGLFISFSLSFHRLSRGLSGDRPTADKTFWRLAREVRTQTSRTLAVQLPFKTLSTFQQSINHNLKHPNDEPMPVQVTNLGRIEVPTTVGKISVEETSFFGSIAAFRRTILISVATFNGHMTINFHTTSPALSQKILDSFANQVIDLLAAETR
ncbi:MAG: condensation domain-containing protein [Cyanobacteria bacterium P01_F01_bin.153]